MARMSIYLTEELKAKMDEVGDVGWSQIAQNAFTQKLALRRIEEEKDMTSVIERLRASKKAFRENNGLDAGKKWAREAAEYNELHAISQAETPDAVLKGIFGGSERFQDVDRRAIDERLMSIFGTTDVKSDSLMLFAKGAKQVWSEIYLDIEDD